MRWIELVSAFEYPGHNVDVTGCCECFFREKHKIGMKSEKNDFGWNSIY